MKNLAFLAWVLLFPVMDSLGGWLSRLHRQPRVYSDGVEAGAAIVTLAIWAVVGWLLYER